MTRLLFSGVLYESVRQSQFTAGFRCNGDFSALCAALHSVQTKGNEHHLKLPNHMVAATHPRPRWAFPWCGPPEELKGLKENPFFIWEVLLSGFDRERYGEVTCFKTTQ